jgi:predicted nucleic acid-binding Zn ribbon protein
MGRSGRRYHRAPMPTYVYKFVKTGETIEVQQSFTDPALTKATHPVTGKKMAVKKVFLPVGITFKGDGFYKTDSRSGSKKSSSSGSDASTGSDSSSKSESKSDSGSKSESTSASKSSSASSSGSDSSGSSPAKT